MNRVSFSQTFNAQPTQDGAGVKIRRVHHFGGRLDPFLMLDELKASNEEDYIGGFPPHPHRGFETLTYLIHGGLTHEDSMGNRGEVHAGEAQWMSAGNGVIHSEMPLTDQQGLHGFQAWINLPARRKRDQPQYRDLKVSQMGQLKLAHWQFKAIAGQWSVDKTSVQSQQHQLGEAASMADAQLEAQSQLTLQLPAGERLLIYVYQGQLNAALQAGQLGVIDPSEEARHLDLHSGTEESGFLLLRGKPLNEPIAHYGPFVMNNEAEIQQAIHDYQTGQLTQQPSDIH